MRNNRYLCRRKTILQMLVQFKQYLETKGIKPTTEVEGQITFLSNSLYYLFVYDSTDPNYFRIILPNVFKVEDNKDKYDILVNELNQRFKVAKTYITSEGMIWIAADQFIYSREGIDLMFERCIALLKIVIDYFRVEQNNISHD